MDGRSGSAGAADVVVRAEEEAADGAVDMLDDERSVPAPAPARSQGFGGDGMRSVCWTIGGSLDSGQAGI